MSGVQTKIILPDQAGMRLDRWFKVYFPMVSHGLLEKYLRKGQIRVSGSRAKSNHRLVVGEEIRIPPLPAVGQSRPNPKPHPAYLIDDLKQMIIFEDETMLALNKPFGLAVQGGTHTKYHLDGMLAGLEKDNERPRLVHRLDKDTGGLLLVAKTRLSAQKLGDAFKKHKVDKTYWALTAGTPRPREGTISMPIAKRMVRIGDGKEERVIPAEGDDTKNAITDYQTLDDAGAGVAFLAMRPVTGRTHQLRVHAAAIGCPIIGDGKYGGVASQLDGVSDKVHLFCRTMTFPHPKSGKKITISASLTGHMLETWKFFSFDTKVSCDWPEGMR